MPGGPRPDVTIDECTRLYKDSSTYKVAKILKCSNCLVVMRLHEGGVTLRKRSDYTQHGGLKKDGSKENQETQRDER